MSAPGAPPILPWRPAAVPALALAAGLVAAWGATVAASAGPVEQAWLGGLVPELMASPGGQWWRLLTAAGLHLRPGHLLLNVGALLWTATLAMRVLGRGRPLAAWWLGALVASGASLAFTRAWSLGASGANAALIGLLLTEALRARRTWSAERHRLTALAVLPGLAGLVLFGLGPTDHAAHLGGLAAGALLGLWPRAPLRALQAVAATSTAFSIGFAIFHAFERPEGWPPAGWVAVPGWPPCATAYTNGLAHTCAAAPGAGGPPPPAPFQRFDFTGPGGQPRVLFAPDGPRAAETLRALAGAPDPDYTPPP